MAKKRDDQPDEEQQRGKVIELHPPPHDPRDEGSVLTVEGFGAVVQFRTPPSRVQLDDPSQSAVQLVLAKRQRWAWTPEEDKLGFSVRCGVRGACVVVGIKVPDVRGITELWLPLDAVRQRPGHGYSLHSSVLTDRLREVVRHADQTQEELRRAPAKREVLEEAVGVGGL